jgi:hypothetical protein
MLNYLLEINRKDRICFVIKGAKVTLVCKLYALNSCILWELNKELSN